MLQIFGRAAKKGKRILQIGLVTQDQEMGKQIKEFVAKRESVNMLLIKSATVTPTKFPEGVSIFVYDLNSTGEVSLKEFDRFMSERPQSVPVIVLSPSVEDALLRWFLRLRVSDWLKTPLSPGELISACGRVISQSNSVRPEVKCLTFVGARGGVGTTTMAIHAALQQARAGVASASTCLVDLDLVAGACSDYLDLVANWQIDELTADPSRLDSHMLDTMTAAHKSGITVLSAHRKFAERFTFSADIITHTLDLATQKFQNLVVDLPSHAESWSDSVILGSSQVYVITDFTVPGLKSARRIVDDIATHYEGEVVPKVIVNKYSKSFFAGRLSASEAKTLLRDSLAGFVRNEESLLREAIDRGIPSTDIKKNNGVAVDLAKIIGT